MKTKILSLLLLFVFIMACNKDDNDNNGIQVDEEVHFKVKLNGQLYQADVDNLQAGVLLGTLAIDTYRNATKESIDVVFDYQGSGTYSCDADDSSNYIGYIKTDENNTIIKSLQASICTMQMQVSGGNGGEVIGVFSGQLINDDTGETIEMTDGSFRMEVYGVGI